MNRRAFLKRLAKGAAAATAVGTTGFPTIVSAAALGRDGKIAPSNRIAMGALGLGWMGMANMETFLTKDEVQIVALCDIDKNHLASGMEKVKAKYGSECESHHDFRDLIVRGDLDAVMIALPDHWHAIPAIMAVRAGLDVYGEKPLSYSLEEGRAMCDAVARYNRVWQTGAWQRSKANFHKACELVRNGRIGKVDYVEVGLGDGHADFDNNKDETAPRTPPAHIDYDMWLGPAPWTPYSPAKLHKSWRWNWDYGGGMLSDWVCHHVDIAHWALGFDYTGPIEIDATGVCPQGIWNTPTEYDVHLTYANGVKMYVGGNLPGGAKFYGDKGWIHVSREYLEANPKSVLDEEIGPGETRLYQSTDHWQNFIDCVKSRQLTISPIEVLHRSTSVAHLGLAGIRVGRKLKWDPAKEQIIGDPDASRFLGRAYRAPWRLEA